MVSWSSSRTNASSPCWAPLPRPHALYYGARGEKKRLDLADGKLREACTSYGLENFYSETIEAAHYCRELRNQYVHSTWIGGNEGLFYASIEAAVEKNTDEVILIFNYIDVPLLAQQELFFAHTQTRLWWLKCEIFVRAGRKECNDINKPKPMPQPPTELGATILTQLVSPHGERATQCVTDFANIRRTFGADLVRFGALLRVSFCTILQRSAFCKSSKTPVPLGFSWCCR
jgi:hypothetical protein